jgi:hypothetical protein
VGKVPSELPVGAVLLTHVLFSPDLCVFQPLGGRGSTDEIFGQRHHAPGGLQRVLTWHGALDGAVHGRGPVQIGNAGPRAVPLRPVPDRPVPGTELVPIGEGFDDGSLDR